MQSTSWFQSDINYYLQGFDRNIWFAKRGNCYSFNDFCCNLKILHYIDAIMSECLLNRFLRCRSKKTSKLRVTGLCKGNSPVTGELLAQRGSNAENISIWWRHLDIKCVFCWGWAPSILPLSSQCIAFRVLIKQPRWVWVNKSQIPIINSRKNYKKNI